MDRPSKSKSNSSSRGRGSRRGRGSGTGRGRGLTSRGSSGKGKGRGTGTSSAPSIDEGVGPVGTQQAPKNVSSSARLQKGPSIQYIHRASQDDDIFSATPSYTQIPRGAAKGGAVSPAGPGSQTQLRPRQRPGALPGYRSTQTTQRPEPEGQIGQWDEQELAQAHPSPSQTSINWRGIPATSASSLSLKKIRANKAGVSLAKKKRSISILSEKVPGSMASMKSLLSKKKKPIAIPGVKRKLGKGTSRSSKDVSVTKVRSPSNSSSGSHSVDSEGNKTVKRRKDRWYGKECRWLALFIVIGIIIFVVGVILLAILLIGKGAPINITDTTSTTTLSPTTTRPQNYYSPNCTYPTRPPTDGPVDFGKYCKQCTFSNKEDCKNKCCTFYYGEQPNKNLTKCREQCD